MKKSGNKIIVILGPTGSGKSELAVRLAKKFGGEVVSADSRQIYKGMDIGTGKITKKEMRGVPHHLLDVVSPKKVFTVIDFKKRAEKAIKDIIKRGKIPIICGGTGFYIQAITNGISIPEVKPNWKLRKQLEKKTAEQLFKMLKKLNPERAKTIDPKNPRRLIRAIEIIKSLGKVPRTTLGNSNSSPWQILQIGIKLPEKDLKKKIEKRIYKMINPPAGGGLEKEVKKLVKKYGWTKVLKSTIGYQEWQNENPIENIKKHTLQYTKRQMTWFKKYSPKTKWVKNYREAEKLLKN